MGEVFHMSGEVSLITKLLMNFDIICKWLKLSPTHPEARVVNENKDPTITMRLDLTGGTFLEFVRGRAATASVCV